MNQPVLNIEQLTVESFTVADPETSQDAQVDDVHTGCLSDCPSGCGIGHSFC